jgi:hypothetical protein
MKSIKDHLKNSKIKNKRAQVWIETVVYTLIAFVMIGLVLSFVKPKIEESKDKAIIKQSMEMMESINSIMEEIKTVPGNKRLIGLGIKKGELVIDASKDIIIFESESEYQYSEYGEIIEEGNLKIMTQKRGDLNRINITKDFSDDFNITWQGDDISKTISSASTIYKVFIENVGEDSNQKTVINFELG